MVNGLLLRSLLIALYQHPHSQVYYSHPDCSFKGNIEDITFECLNFVGAIDDVI